MKRKCSICLKSYELYDLYCVTSGRGANSNCDDLCVLLCENCLSNFKG